MMKQLDQVELEDLISSGYFGLISAVHSFDPKKGFSFSTFAFPRIRGAILDDLRRNDTSSRGVRRMQRAIAEAAHAVEAKIGRKPTDSEIAETMGVSLERLWDIRTHGERSAFHSIDRPIKTADGREARLGDTIPDPESAVAPFENRDEMKFIEKNIAKLTKRQQQIIRMYFFEEFNLREIGELLGVTESCVSQTRTKALKKLRELMT